MNTISSVFKTAEMFMEDPKFVIINDENIEILSKKMLEEGKLDFFKEEGDAEDFQNINFNDEIRMELLASSINYCYWYGKFDVRPGEACSTLMYAFLSEEYSRHNRKIDMQLIDNFVGRLAENRFPLIEERAKHLVQTAARWNRFIPEILNNKEEVGPLIDLMVKVFPGFASDIFLKRASLFFIQLSRKFQWYKETIKDIHIPADYQVPKMLKYYKCVEYHVTLNTRINAHSLIPKGSLMECEIRASTILACRKLAEQTGWLPPEIDTWLWTKRKECDDPFHLTITTDY